MPPPHACILSPPRRRAYSNCAVYNGQGIMLGGQNDTYVFNDVWSLEPEHLTWRVVSGFPQVVALHLVCPCCCL